jgi:nucleotide-binding universal stress UspA family protein
MLPIRAILYPTDFSPRSEYAFQLASALARDYSARLIVVHVVQPPAVAYGEMFIDLPSETFEGIKDRAQEALRQLPTPAPQVTVETRVVEGDPATQIVQLAQDARCDLIVMGTHGRTGLGRLLMGSVAEQVLRKAPCPVLTVKAPLAETAAAPAAPAQEPAKT